MFKEWNRLSKGKRLLGILLVDVTGLFFLACIHAALAVLLDTSTEGMPYLTSTVVGMRFVLTVTIMLLLMHAATMAFLLTMCAYDGEM